MEVDVIIQNAIRIESKKGRVIYFDPFHLGEKYSNDADLIFITHSHFDHFSPEDINKIKNDDTIIIVTQDLTQRVISLGFENNNIKTVNPGDNYIIKEIQFETIPAYNINKDFHKKEYNWVGYIVEIDGERIYVAGDTDATIETKEVKCDIAFVPVGGTYTMTCQEAMELVKIIKPKLAIPTHYGSIVGSIEDGARFKQALENEIKVELYIK